MFEFVLFLRSLFHVIIEYIYNHHIIKLRKFYSQLGQIITRNQRNFIVWPVSIAFILSYPAIYSLYTSSASFETSFLTDLQTRGIGIQPTTIQNLDLENINKLTLKQIWLSPREPIDSSSSPNDIISAGALDKEFLIDSLKLQDQLLEGINTDFNNFAYIHTPFEVWNNSLDILEKDKSPLKALRRSSAKNSNSCANGLLSGVVKVNGLIKSAEAIRILIFYKETGLQSLDAGKLWENNLEKIKESENFTSFNFIEKNGSPSSLTKLFLLRLTKMNSIDHFILNSSYILIVVYFLISLSNLKSVRSRIGLLVAFVVEISLAILSSATLTTYFFQGVDFHQVPLQFLPFIVVVVGIENTFRLVTSISGTPGEQSVSYRITQALSESGITSTLVFIFDLILLLLTYPFVSSNTKQFFIFAGITLTVDHILHLTFFAAVLSVDIHRMELNELLNSENDKKWLNSIFGSRRLSLNDSLYTYQEKSYFVKFAEFIKSIKLPFSTTATGTIVIILFLIGTNIRWTGDSVWNAFKNKSSASLGNAGFEQIQLVDGDNILLNFVDKKSFSSEIINLSYRSGQKDLSRVLVKLDVPDIVFHGGDSPTPVDRLLDFSLNTTYKFDLYYVLEFLTSLAFILSIVLLILKIYSQDNPASDYSDDHKKEASTTAHSFNSKLLTGGHFLDIIKIETSRSPFIASVGLDHKLLVWSPASQPMPVPSQLPINSTIWPITRVVLSDQGNFIAVFSKTGFIQCYSRLTMAWLWKIEIAELKNTTPLEAFFRVKTIPAFLQRKMATDLLKQKTSAPSSRRNSMRSIASAAIVPALSFSNTSGAHSDLKELVIVLKDGRVARVSCEDGQLTTENLSNSKLVSSAKLITPRVNDRLVSTTEDGKVLLSTAVNNKWKTRIVHIDEHKFNNPEAFLTNPPVNAELTEEQRLKLTEEFRRSAIAIVPFVGFIVRTLGTFAEIIDAQTGILIKRFQVRKLKKDTLHVFHDQPTHCRFCGSVSITSFTVVYTTETNSVVMHTFNVDHRAKTSICLRVERDPREIRCAGFDQVTEHQHELENVEGWSSTDKNQIVGIRRKTEEEVKVSLTEPKNSTLRRRNTRYNRDHDQNAPRLHDLWGGWSMAADGKVDYYEIPDGGNSGGLLVNSIGQINSFGHKSIVVAFGNIMKVLYLGNDNLIFNDEELGKKTEISGLNFVNKRRKNLKKHDNLSSTNFSEIDTVPGISELAL